MKKSPGIKIAITGAGGFLGASTLDYFSLDPQVTEIRALFSSAPKKELSDKTVPIVGELKNSIICQALVEGVDCVFHFANRGFPADGERNPARLIGLNLHATEQLLQTMKQAGVKNIIYASSGGAIYRDSSRHQPYREESPTVLRTPYAANKLISEYVIEEFSRNFQINSTLLRLSNPFGLGQLNREKQGLIGVMLGKLLKHEPIKIWSSLDIVKDFIYIDDVLSALDSILKSDKPVTGTYNLGSGVGKSLMEVIQSVEKVTQRQIQFELIPNPIPENQWTVLNCSKFMNATGWKCQHGLEDGIEELWDHLVSELEVKAA
ncbi:MAG: NAD-dependent epimerase/dehydratase family protein [Proteobacteria bacterium]|nr:NAD-dependent epimerase/dehydratase family protein [Pseudomonadota bacterium]